MKQIQYKFSNFPVRYELKDYQEIRDRYIRRVAKLADVKAIYQLGDISVPGISDIDLMVVLNDKLQDSSFKDYTVQSLGGRSRYLFMHNPFIVDESLFSSFSLFPYAERMKAIKVSDEEFSFKDVSIKAEPINRIADVIDNTGSLLRSFTFMLTSGYCPVRSTLVKLNALAINIDDFNKITGKSRQSWDEFSNQIKVLRKVWFFLKETDQKKQLVILLNKAFSISYELSFSLANYLRDTGYISILNSMEPLIAQQSFLRFSVFSNTSGEGIVELWKETMRHLNVDNLKGYKLFLVFFPFAFYAQWSCYSQEEGEFSRSFRNYLSLGEEAKIVIQNSAYKDILCQRIKFLDKQISFLKKNKFYYGLLLQPPVKPYFYGAKRSNIRRIVRYPLEHFFSISHRHRLIKTLKNMELQ